MCLMLFSPFQCDDVEYEMAVLRLPTLWRVHGISKHVYYRRSFRVVLEMLYSIRLVVRLAVEAEEWNMH